MFFSKFMFCRNDLFDAISIQHEPILCCPNLRSIDSKMRQAKVKMRTRIICFGHIAQSKVLYFQLVAISRIFMHHNAPKRRREKRFIICNYVDIFVKTNNLYTIIIYNKLLNSCTLIIFLLLMYQ